MSWRENLSREFAELHAKRAPLIDELTTIYRAHGFGSVPMDGPTCNRWDELMDARVAIDAAFDAAHPVGPCPACGEERLASTAAPV